MMTRPNEVRVKLICFECGTRYRVDLETLKCTPSAVWCSVCLDRWGYATGLFLDREADLNPPSPSTTPPRDWEIPF
jgi:predicted Zn finger-like uncharacterized protein